jgi:hypothetical protein
MLFGKGKQEERARIREQNLEYYKAVVAAQRGIKRLKRKLETRNAYVAVMEKYFFTEGGRDADSAERVFEARRNLGLIKRPRPKQA